MPGGDIARQWFIPGEGIDRHVISADIQRYLGNDATVRPGQGTGENQGVNGFWIKAYRNLTSAMIADLRADSARWRQEQRMTGTREPYVGSRTHETGNASRVAQRRDGDSPAVDAPYGVPPSRTGGRSQVDAMQIDPPGQPDRRYGQPNPSSRNYPSDVGAYPQSRDRYGDAGRPAYPSDQPMVDAYGRGPPAPAGYPSEPRYPANYGGQQPNGGAPPGYVKSGDYYVPVTSGYNAPSTVAPSRPEPQSFPSGPYGGQAPPPPSGRDPRDRDMRDRGYGQPEYNDPSRYYPSPTTTTASVGSREPMTSPNQPSGYGPPQYDQYGRPINAQPYGVQEPPYQPAREPAYGRESRQPAPPSGGSDRDRDARRRRLH